MGELGKYLIVDTDMGLDDAWGLVLLLTLGKLLKVKILAITCVFGNTDLPNVSSNAFRVLNSMGVIIPVYNGKSKPLLPELLNEVGYIGYYGKDGFADEYPPLNTTRVVQKEEAAEAIYKLVKRYPNQISYINLGPLSNLAAGLAVHEDLLDYFKNIFVMGGNAYGVGNVLARNTAEWNFYSDPEAANLVISQTKTPITILTWEACLRENFYISTDWRFNGPLKNIPSEIISMLNKLEKKVADGHNAKTWGPPDALLVAAALYGEQMIQEMKNVTAYVEVSGHYTRGQIALDSVSRNAPINAHLITKVSASAFQDLVLKAAKLTV